MIANQVFFCISLSAISMIVGILIAIALRD